MDEELIEQLCWFHVSQRYFTETIINEVNDPNIHFVNVPLIRVPKDPFGQLPLEGIPRTFQPSPKRRLYWKSRSAPWCKEFLTRERFIDVMSGYRIDETEAPLDNPPEENTNRYRLFVVRNENDGYKSLWFKVNPDVHIFVDKDIVKDFSIGFNNERRINYETDLEFRFQVIDKNEYPEEYIEHMENVIH